MIIVNGVEYNINGSFTINNGEVIIDGKRVEPNDKVINIVIQGDFNGDYIKIDNCNKFEVNGNITANKVETVNGNINSDCINGDVETVNGDIGVSKINGNVKTVNGDIVR